MTSNSIHLWGNRAAAGNFGRNQGNSSPILVSKRNNLSSQDSIEDNTLVPNSDVTNEQKITNTESLNRVAIGNNCENTHGANRGSNDSRKKMLPRQKSLSYFEKELESILRRCTPENIERNDTTTGDDVRHQDGHPHNNNTKPTGNRSARSSIYSTYIQQGDGNLMLLCEPMGPTKRSKCCKQVGNNNVIVNVTVNTNRCQIINEQGQVCPIDSDGEFWLEIRKRRPDSEGGGSVSPDSTITPAGGAGQPEILASRNSYDDARIVRQPEENEYSESVSYSQVNRTSSPYLESRLPMDDLRRQPVEHFDAFETFTFESIHQPCDKTNTGNIRIDEQPDAIVMKFEAPPGSPRLSGCHGFEDCDLIKTALGHKKVIDFLQKQEKDFDVDLSVIGWEYEREEIYSTIPHENGASLDENNLSPSPVQIVRKPTLPPRSRADGESIDGHGYDSIEDLNIQAKHDKQQPELPPRRYKEQEENSEQESFDKSKLSVVSIGFGSCFSTLGDNAESITVPKTPRNQRMGLPSPPCVPKTTPRQRKPKQETPNSSDKSPTAPWYHGGINSEEAKALLYGKPNGSFLVRDTNGEHKYTLEFVDSELARRLKIWYKDNKYRLEKGSSQRYKDFESVEDLIEAAMKSGIEVSDKKSPATWRTVAIFAVNKS